MDNGNPEYSGAFSGAQQVVTKSFFEEPFSQIPSFLQSSLDPPQVSQNELLRILGSTTDKEETKDLVFNAVCDVIQDAQEPTGLLLLKAVLGVLTSPCQPTDTETVSTARTSLEHFHINGTLKSVKDLRASLSGLHARNARDREAFRQMVSDYEEGTLEREDLIGRLGISSQCVDLIDDLSLLSRFKQIGKFSQS